MTNEITIYNAWVQGVYNVRMAVQHAENLSSISDTAMLTFKELATYDMGQYIYNKFQAGNSGIGGSSTAVRRAKNRLASVCGGSNGQCGPFYTYLGRYNSYTENPNGYFPYPPNQYPGKSVTTFISPAINYPI